MRRAQHRATLDRISEWSPVTRSLFLRLEPERPLVFTPGQFVSLELPTGGDRPLVRAYSIASSTAERDLLELCVDRVPGGLGSTYLFGLEPGAAVDLNGPFGTFTAGAPPAAEMVFVADATSIAPIRPIVAHILERGGDQPITVLHGARSARELLFRDEFQAWMRRHPRLQWEPVMATSDVPAGEHPVLERLVSERFIDGDTDRSRHFWICAVGDLVHRLRDCLRAAGYERKAIRYEKW